MPVATCSAMAAGPLPSTTQATEGDGLVGSWGAANTAPSGLSAAVTRSAENGSAIGDPGCKGPVVDTGGNVEAGVAAVVVVVDVGAAPPWCVVVVAACGVGGPELHDASTSAATAASAAATARNPNCTTPAGLPGHAGQYGVRRHRFCAGHAAVSRRQAGRTRMPSSTCPVPDTVPATMFAPTNWS